MEMEKEHKETEPLEKFSLHNIFKGKPKLAAGEICKGESLKVTRVARSPWNVSRKVLGRKLLE